MEHKFVSEESIVTHKFISREITRIQRAEGLHEKVKCKIRKTKSKQKTHSVTTQVA